MKFFHTCWIPLRGFYILVGNSKTSLLTVAFLLGAVFGYLIGDVPDVEKEVRLKNDLIETARQLELSDNNVQIYQQRCVDWLNYTHRLENPE